MVRAVFHWLALRELYRFFQETAPRRQLYVRNPYPLEQATRSFFYAGSNLHSRITLNPFCGEGQYLPKGTEMPTCEDNVLAGGHLGSTNKFSTAILAHLFCPLFARDPPHSFGYVEDLPPQSDEKIYANLTDFILSAILLSLANYSSFVTGGVPCTRSTFTPGVMPRV